MFSLITFGVFMGIAFAAPPGIVTAETFRRGVARGFPAALSVQLGSLIGDATYCLLALAGVAVLVQNPIMQRALGIVSVCLLMYLAVTGIASELRAEVERNGVRSVQEEGVGNARRSVPRRSVPRRSVPHSAERERNGVRSVQEESVGNARRSVPPRSVPPRSVPRRSVPHSAERERNGVRSVPHKNAFLTGMFLSLTNPWAIGFWLSLGGTLASYGAIQSGDTMAMFFVSFFGACLVYAFGMAFLIGVTHKAMPLKLGKWISIGCSVTIGILGIGVAMQVVQLFLNG